MLMRPGSLFGFGFHAHRIINREAVYTIPGEPGHFFRSFQEYLSEKSIDPDKLAHIVPGEASRHFIDLEHYSAYPDSLYHTYKSAIGLFSEDSLMAWGRLPWHIALMTERLTMAFASRDTERILRHAAHLGHYIADACTPLHTTRWYNGRTPGERGIHALWESRIPELFSDGFCFLSGRAVYIEDPLAEAWNLVRESHLKTDSIYRALDRATKGMSTWQQFAVEARGSQIQRVYSMAFCELLHKEMDQMTERQMRRAVGAVGSFWFTAWVNAGQPDLKASTKKPKRLLQRLMRMGKHAD